MHGPAWSRTLLIWLYDEHGGYFDHVPPGPAPPPDDLPGRSLLALPAWAKAVLRLVFPRYIATVADIDTGPQNYDTYGFRVPAAIVSPYARPHRVGAHDRDLRTGAPAVPAFPAACPRPAVRRPALHGDDRGLGPAALRRARRRMEGPHDPGDVTPR